MQTLNFLPEFLQNIVHLQAIGSVVLLCFFIIATTILQKRSVDRSREVLHTATDEVKGTALYASAVLYMNRRSEAAKNMFTDGSRPCRLSRRPTPIQR
jgi:hypothetical protein